VDGRWNFQMYGIGLVLAVITLAFCQLYTLSFQLSVFLCLTAAYLPSYLDGTERTAEGRAWLWIMKLKLWNWCMEGWTLKLDAPLDPQRQSIICAFPHGVIAYCHAAIFTDGIGWFSKKVHDADKRDLGATVLFRIPIIRDIVLWFGIVDAGRSTAVKVLESGRSVYVVPGGEMEQMLTIEGKHRLFINHRKGFVRLAVEFGCDLVPLYAFGETSLYSVSNFMLPLRIWICKKFHVALPICYSKRWGIPIPFLYHKNVPYSLCVGQPLPVKKLSPKDPQFNQTVDEVHEQFKQSLVKLFDHYKKECGYPDAVLEFI